MYTASEEGQIQKKSGPEKSMYTQSLCTFNDQSMSIGFISKGHLSSFLRHYLL